MAVVLSLLAALTYGAADFIGGFVAKKVHVLSVVLISQLIGTIPFLMVFPFLNDTPFSGHAFWWGTVSGIAGGTGVTLLYAGLAKGRMSVVAPVTAVEAAVVPVIFGLISGERPSPLALTGVAAAVVAVALISSAPDPDPSDDIAARGRATPGLLHALGAGAAFGAFFIFLDLAGDRESLWPLVGTRTASISLVTVAILVTTRSVSAPRSTLPAIAWSGLFDMAANIFYLLATRQGLLSLVAVITSMYPATTVLLARVVLKERLGRTQLLGIACAAIGIALISGG